MKTKTPSPDRYNLIDALRGAAILSMILFHLAYDLFCVFGLDPHFAEYPLVIAWERTICVTFILISGMSLHFSHHPYRRGVIVNLCGFLITVVTVLVMPTQAVWFGVLNLIGCAMMITYAASGWLKKCLPAPGAGAALLLFGIFYRVQEGYLGFFGLRIIDLPQWLYGSRYPAFMGFPSRDFYSADYFPILPWVFLFICGWFLWRFIEERGWQRFFRVRVRGLDFIGQHSLIIYMAHQPVLYGLCLLMAAAGWIGQ